MTSVVDGPLVSGGLWPGKPSIGAQPERRAEFGPFSCLEGEPVAPAQPLG